MAGAADQATAAEEAEGPTKERDDMQASSKEAAPVEEEAAEEAAQAEEKAPEASAVAEAAFAAPAIADEKPAEEEAAPAEEKAIEASVGEKPAEKEEEKTIEASVAMEEASATPADAGEKPAEEEAAPAEEKALQASVAAEEASATLAAADAKPAEEEAATQPLLVSISEEGHIEQSEHESLDNDEAFEASSPKDEQDVDTREVNDANHALMQGFLTSHEVDKSVLQDACSFARSAGHGSPSCEERNDILEHDVSSMEFIRSDDHGTADKVNQGIFESEVDLDLDDIPEQDGSSVEFARSDDHGNADKVNQGIFESEVDLDVIPEQDVSSMEFVRSDDHGNADKVNQGIFQSEVDLDVIPEHDVSSMEFVRSDYHGNVDKVNQGIFESEADLDEIGDHSEEDFDTPRHVLCQSSGGIAQASNEHEICRLMEDLHASEDHQAAELDDPEEFWTSTKQDAHEPPATCSGPLDVVESAAQDVETTIEFDEHTLPCVDSVDDSWEHSAEVDGQELYTKNLAKSSVQELGVQAFGISSDSSSEHYPVFSGKALAAECEQMENDAVGSQQEKECVGSQKGDQEMRGDEQSESAPEMQGEASHENLLITEEQAAREPISSRSTRCRVWMSTSARIAAQVGRAVFIAVPLVIYADEIRRYTVRQLMARYGGEL